MRSDRERLLDILEAIDRIEKYAVRGRAAFENDELVQNWIVRHMQILGEAIRHISEEIKNKNPDIPWSEITGMRNILVHGYFDVDLDILWNAVTGNIPLLKKKIRKILDKLEDKQTNSH